MIALLALLLTTADRPGITVKESRVAMAKLAACMVELKHDAIAKEILADNSSDKMRSTFIRMLDAKSCPGDRNAAGAILVMMLSESAHFAMAEALVSSDLAAPVSSLSGAPRIPNSTFDSSVYEPRPNRKYSDEQIRNLRLNADRARYLSDLSKVGECVVRSDTANAHSLLLSPVESSLESLRFAALKPAVSKCLPSGRSFSLDKAMLRGAVGYNFYRLAKAAALPEVTR